MLTENQVVDIVCEWLKKRGYRIESFCHDTSKGDDIVAIYPDGFRLRIECKGSLSKAGKPFAMHYLWQSAAGAFFNTVRANETAASKTVYGIAIPDSKEFHALLGDLEAFFVRQNIPVFWVIDGESVNLWGNA